MPIVEIYKAGKRIGSKEFRAQFYIIEERERGKLRWESDEEQGLSKKGGVVEIWIITRTCDSVTKQEIAFVKPEWQLTIDGTAMERGFYHHVDVGGKVVELQYMDYRFVIPLL
jgi:hypothetical protein